MLRAVRRAVGPHIALRADANQGWTLRQATQFVVAMSPKGIRNTSRPDVRLEYLEEPLGGGPKAGTAESWRALAQLAADRGVPLALDESIDTGMFSPFFLWHPLSCCYCCLCGVMVVFHVFLKA